MHCTKRSIGTINQSLSELCHTHSITLNQINVVGILKLMRHLPAVCIQMVILRFCRYNSLLNSLI